MSSSAVISKSERRRRIFLAARETFNGPNGKIRDRNVMIRVISKNERPFRDAIQSFSRNIVYDVIHSLLTNQVFESELKAKLQFPELYSVSAVRGLQHDASEQEAARSEQVALEELAQSPDDVYVQYNEDDYQTPEMEGQSFLNTDNEYLAVDKWSSELSAGDEEPKRVPFDSPSLFPAYLSYSVQHKLLNGVQRLLEQCLYEFTAKRLPDLLKEKKWDCAEAVELGRWSEVLPSQFERLSDEMRSNVTSFKSREAFFRALVATHPLRHAAVHRLPTHGKGLEQMLQTALSLVKALHDLPRTTKMKAVIEGFQSKRQDMELNKNHLENQLDEELAKIQAQRAALDVREREAKETMVRNDLENTKAVSSLFEKSIAKLRVDADIVESRKEVSDNEDVDAESLQKAPTTLNTNDQARDPLSDTQDASIADLAALREEPACEDQQNSYASKDFETSVGKENPPGHLASNKDSQSSCLEPGRVKEERSPSPGETMSDNEKGLILEEKEPLWENEKEDAWSSPAKEIGSMEYVSE